MKLLLDTNVLAGVLRESLMTLEGTRFLEGGVERVDALAWTSASIVVT